jgi:hypothetical protein
MRSAAITRWCKFDADGVRCLIAETIPIRRAYLTTTARLRPDLRIGGDLLRVQSSTDEEGHAGDTSGRPARVRH